MKPNARKALGPAQILTLGFLAVVLLGAYLLCLPIAVNDGVSPLNFVDALFTSTSAVCVTGLTVVNTGLTFSLFGKIVLICLIQVGGLGFMTVAAILFMVIGKHITLRNRVVIQESFSTDTLQGLSKLVLNAIIVTFSIEASGAILLMFRMIPTYGTATGIFYSVFLAISAFCNAGFDPFGFECSIVEYQTDPLINLVLMALVILGGTGFAVIAEVCKPKKNRPLSLHSRVVLAMSAALLVVGTALILLTEWSNPETLG
ncbi:MAG: Trk family potassium uptake protein, partial [Clostridia bacterium]|nr:Trk family potassium uptake protein [Clostridia bacterium]